MQDIADYLGISKNSVSMALNDKPGIGEQLKAQIIQVAETLNYADYGLKKKDRVKGNLLVCTAEHVKDANKNYFFHDIIDSIQHDAYQHGMDVMIKPISRKMEESQTFPGILQSANFLGILLVGVFHESYLEGLQKYHLPMVLVDNDYDLDIELDSVVTAHRIGGKQIVKYLIEQGHQEIGFIAPVKVASAFRERWRAYIDGLEAAGLTRNPDYCIIKTEPNEYSYWDTLEELAPKLSHLESHPTAWVCGNDGIAITLLKILSRQQIRVPDHVSVVGFDDIHLAQQIIPELTTIGVRKKEIGSKAVELLINRIKNPNTPKMRVSLFTNLVVRESVKSLKPK